MKGGVEKRGGGKQNSDGDERFEELCYIPYSHLLRLINRKALSA